MTETKQKPSLASQLFLPYEMLEQINQQDLLGNGAVLYLACDNKSEKLKSSVMGNAKDLCQLLTQVLEGCPDLAEVMFIAIIQAAPEGSVFNKIGKKFAQYVKEHNNEQDDEE